MSASEHNQRVTVTGSSNTQINQNMSGTQTNAQYSTSSVVSAVDEALAELRTQVQAEAARLADPQACAGTLESLERQLHEPSPDRHVLRALFERLRSLTAGVTTVTTAIGAVEAAVKLLTK